jgi:all-trans-8'-apo-beta-carotenal 15,15'-oxygenase
VRYANCKHRSAYESNDNDNAVSRACIACTCNAWSCVCDNADTNDKTFPFGAGGGVGGGPGDADAMVAVFRLGCDRWRPSEKVRVKSVVARRFGLSLTMRRNSSGGGNLVVFIIVRVPFASVPHNACEGMTHSSITSSILEKTTTSTTMTKATNLTAMSIMQKQSQSRRAPRKIFFGAMSSSTSKASIMSMTMLLAAGVTTMPPTAIVVDAFIPTAFTSTTRTGTTTVSAGETTVTENPSELSSSNKMNADNGNDDDKLLYDKQAWIQGFQNVEEESSYMLEDDNFPSDLVGTFYQNGHTKFYFNNNENEFHIHPFDADGMMSAVTFIGGNNNNAWFRNRYIETLGYTKEKVAGRALFRGVFGTAPNKGKWWSNIFRLKTKNVANTHCLCFQPPTNTDNNSNPPLRLFALWEGGRPYEIDPVTLKTLTKIDDGKDGTDLDGTIDERYAAHYKIDPITQTVCNFAINVDGPTKHTIQVMEHDQQTMELVYKHDYSGFPGIGVSHDCAITKDYFVFLQAPVKFDPIPFLLGKKGPAQCIDNDDEIQHSSLILIPRGKEKGEPIVIQTPKMFTFHLSNAYQDTKTGELIVDMILADSMFMAETTSSEYPTQPIWETFDFDNGLKYELRRVRVDLKTKSFLSMKSMTDGIANVEFPVINPAVVGQEYRYAYIAASNTVVRNGVVQGMAKVDVQKEQVIDQWKPLNHEFLGEVSFCSRPNQDQKQLEEDYGYLITYLFNGKTKSSELVIFDAKDIGSGPISRTPLKYMMNFNLHGVFIPGYTPQKTE